MLKNYSPFRKSVIRNHLCNKACGEPLESVYLSTEMLEKLMDNGFWAVDWLSTKRLPLSTVSTEAVGEIRARRQDSDMAWRSCRFSRI